MTNVAEARTASGQAQRTSRPGQSAGLFAQTEIDLRLFGMLVALGIILGDFPHHERRQADSARAT